jgi:hypothetical protein
MAGSGVYYFDDSSMNSLKGKIFNRAKSLNIIYLNNNRFHFFT